jgi:hypothetical protein
VENSRSFRRFMWVIVLFLFLLSGVPQAVVHADLGLPLVNPGGSSVELPEGERTNVRMVEEEVNLTIEPYIATIPGEYNMRGKVEAVFLMRNLGSTDEALEVWFPLATSVRYPGVLSYTPERFVQDFKIWVDNVSLSIQQVKAPDLAEPSKESLWATFPITFPAGKDVTVRVTYTLYPSGYDAFGSFEYILQTGADWNGTIGKAVIKVNLPYPVTNENVSLSGTSIIGMPLAPQPTGYIIEDNVIRWEFTDLEPGPQDNISVDVLEPKRYQALLDARSRAASQPDSADDQFALATATSNALCVVKYVNPNGGGEELAQQANLAYRRALELAPDREEFYVAYIDWMMASEGWLSLLRDGICPAETCDVLQRALELFPDNADLVSLDENIDSLLDDWAYRNQIFTSEAPTASAGTQQALTATALVEVSKLTSTHTEPRPTATTPPLVTVSPTSQLPSETPLAISDLQEGTQGPDRGLTIFWASLIAIIVIVFIFRLIWNARRK